VAIAHAWQLEGRPTVCQLQSIWAVFGQICTAHAHKLLTAISKGSNNLAIRRRFHAVTLTFDI